MCACVCVCSSMCACVHVYVCANWSSWFKLPNGIFYPVWHVYLKWQACPHPHPRNQRTLTQHGELAYSLLACLFPPAYLPIGSWGRLGAKSLAQLSVEITQTSSQVLPSGELMSLGESQPVRSATRTEPVLAGTEEKWLWVGGGLPPVRNPLETATGRAFLQKSFLY